MQHLFSPTMIRRMLIGGAIGLLLISLFLWDAGNADPAWGKYWRIRPLVIVPLATAMGGAFLYYMEHLFQDGWKKLLAVVIGLLGFIVSLWLGTVLGLNGTYWN